MKSKGKTEKKAYIEERVCVCVSGRKLADEKQRIPRGVEKKDRNGHTNEAGNHDRQRLLPVTANTKPQIKNGDLGCTCSAS